MKKFSILLAVMALITLAACNKKPAKTEADVNKPATEQTEKAKPESDVKVSVEHAKPTEDGKDKTLTEFNTKEYQVKLENLADGTVRLSMWKTGADKSGKPEQVYETKQCAMSGGSYLMQTSDGKSFIITAKSGAESLVIMDNKKIIYNSNGK